MSSEWDQITDWLPAKGDFFRKPKDRISNLIYLKSEQERLLKQGIHSVIRTKRNGRISLFAEIIKPGE